ncbi:MAG TPA: hypothetical protein VNH11_16885 [Pirellulales bacterium]|nr:hypothetical protein [Pirellulales bacterium]
MIYPAKELEGKTLPGGWVVETLLVPRPTATGGHFSTGYHVRNVRDGREGFLKAMDYSAAFSASDTIDVMKHMAESYTFERDICLKCQASGISRVVHAIDHGTYEGDPGSPLGKFLKVEYLIFERADGDIRSYLDQQQSFDVAFALRTLHGTAAALQQLHHAAIAHQDLKPSNVLVFAVEGRSKLGDLGRAWAKGLRAPHDDFKFAGDMGYAPFELLCGAAVDENTKRFGYDMYLLGSLVVFFFTRVHINALLIKYLDNTFEPCNPAVTFADVLPYLQAAFPKAVAEFSTHAPEAIREKLSRIVTELCDPDPALRGHPMSFRAHRYALERYVSAFDLLRFKAELHLRGKS